MQYYDKHLKLNPSSRVQKFKSPYKVKFTPSSSVKKLENDSPDALKDFLIKTKEKFFSPQPVFNRIEARLDFFESYKKVSMTERRSNFENNSKNAYLQKVSKINLNPKPFGMIRLKEQESCIDLHCYSMGDEYASAFAEGLRCFKNLESLNLRSNRLSDKGSYAIMSTLDVQPIRYLSLCDNVLGTKALGCLFSLLRNPKQCLKHLNLENTRISSSDVINLVSIISTNKSLSFLSLAKNNINHLTSKAIKEMLHYNESLKKLDLHWNTLKIEGVVSILEGLQDNNTLQSLDLSWNAIGNNRNTQLANQLSKLLGKQATLRHLDLSNNYLNASECEIIGSGIINDHKLLIHMEGNECFVDAKGFITSAGYLDQTKSQHTSKVLIDNENSQGGSGSNCWICEKWVQFRFTYNEKCEGPLFIHLECDRYVPEMMNSSNSQFYLDRVIPPGRLKFFFSNLTAPFKSSDYKFEVLPSMLELQADYSSNLQVPIRIVYMNYIETDPVCNKKIEEFESRLREPGLKYFSPSLELVRIEWKFENSIFKDYEIPDDLRLEECFEFDWNLSKLTAMIKIPLQQTQLFELLKSNYNQIYYCYKYLSALSGYDVFAIGVNVLNEHLQLWKVFDNLYRNSDLGVNWSACVVPKDKKQGFGIGNNIVRFQFMEVLVRIASDRFLRNRICSNIVDATRKFLDETFLPSTQEYLISNTWRSTQYFCEEIDLVYKAHKEILDSIYKKYSGSKSLPGQKPFMSLEEFHQFCFDTRLENEKLTSREIDLSFVQSMMIQVDEINKKRHLEMNFVEFLEGFARCCFIAGPAKSTIISEKDQIRRLSGIISKVPLAQIIEKYMPNLLKLCPVNIRENFVYPTTETYKKMMYKYLSMEKIDYELAILTRPYSTLRRRQNKWKYRGSPTDSYVILVDQDYFSTKDLSQRKSLKRSKRIFTEIFRFWQLINPFSIPGLSRAVYSSILRFIYKASFKMHLSEPIFEQYLNNDLNLDFRDEFCLFFCDFYDAFFDIIDQVASGKSIPEYVSAISNLLTQLKYSETLNLINLNNKSHCSGKKPKYVLWMKEFINIKDSNLNDLKSLPRIQSNKHYLDSISPLSIKKRPGMGMKSFLLEEIIEGRNKFLSAYHEEKKRTKAKDVLKKMTGKSYV